MSKQEIIRVLLLADTHLGFDLPRHPRSNRRLRGPDFFDCTRAALSPALRGDADLVIHGGDLLYRSKVRAGLVQAALEPLLEVADTGVPVLLVPGNHERGAIPFPLLTGHPHLHILHHTRTQVLKVDKYTIALGGWPYHREAGLRFRKLLAESTLCDTQADLRLLCVHQAFAGARVEGFRFRADAQTIDARQLPTGIAAVLSGHIHRWQVLEEAPDGSRFGGSADLSRIGGTLLPRRRGGRKTGAAAALSSRRARREAAANHAGSATRQADAEYHASNGFRS